MKIVLINYHYFIHGGPDRYFFNIKEQFERAGHTVVPFSFDYDETRETPLRHYFPEPISGKGTFLLERLQLTKTQKLRYVTRMFYNPQVERKFRSLLHDEKPDLVYSIYLSSSMLPKILKIAKQEFSLPVVYRLSDFHMFCPSYLFYRDGHVCQECLSDLYAAVNYRCVQNSKVASLVRCLQMSMIRRSGWYDNVDAFICPSRVMQQQLIDSGIESERVAWLPTFADDLAGASGSSAPAILYFGKICREKGVDVLIRAYNTLPSPQLPLRIVGYISSEYREMLESYLDATHLPLVTFESPLQGESMWQALRDSAFVAQPGVWLENMPNTLVEALSAGKPVIASDIGSLSELVTNGVNGYLVPPGDVAALAAAIERMLTLPDLAAMGHASRNKYLAEHTALSHLDKLLRKFSELVESKTQL